MDADTRHKVGGKHHGSDRKYLDDVVLFDAHHSEDRLQLERDAICEIVGVVEQGTRVVDQDDHGLRIRPFRAPESTWRGPVRCVFVSAPTLPSVTRMLLDRNWRRHMNAETTETGWKRFLDRIRKLWEAPPQQSPIRIPPTLTGNARREDAPPSSPR